MAQRYGGKYSPTPGDPSADTPDTAAAPVKGSYAGARVDPVGARVNLLFTPAVVMGLMSLTGGALGLATGLGGAALLAAGAFMTREGLRAEAAYYARKVARRPALPRKMIASVLTGLGAGIAAWRNAEAGLLAPLIYGGAALVLHGLAFGIDPLRDKGTEGIDGFQQDRVARAVEEAEAYLTAMTRAIGRTGDRRMEARVEQFQKIARDLFRTVEEDPRDLTGARRYMSVYLMGARDATEKFADLYACDHDARAREDYTRLLTDLEQNFAARTKAMLANDRSDLTVEIEVLRDRLQREGVRLD
ncbi:5-bromo-4-chloroindolyl phosphate hydrolysis family protein [Pseudodonghicola flavimaris]|uniref:5-bromo-4-chloroindolyl phosphate hydrolysis family protein n=1 Tax=Pseudodonghicola flavimaris TaxID=3050036 RepID=A0ABT7F0L8_9RHOB|nr:5-bromo-4-chloroindolyl phosphate hydrolysis family protein [Pseudodonghicola flavimaris]MDK3018151.1 5-bromo-4-chloroindolyl phosphate hydrolysis family protein [Pseudodonghicola flavimaris]